MSSSTANSALIAEYSSLCVPFSQRAYPSCADHMIECQVSSTTTVLLPGQVSPHLQRLFRWGVLVLTPAGSTIHIRMPNHVRGRGCSILDSAVHWRHGALRLQQSPCHVGPCLHHDHQLHTYICAGEVSLSLCWCHVVLLTTCQG